MTRLTSEVLGDALTHFATAETYGLRNLADQAVVDAVCLRISAGIEALARLDSDTRDELFGEDWPLMWGMRNRIVHGYMLVDASIVRQTLVDDIPLIVGKIHTFLDAV